MEALPVLRTGDTVTRGINNRGQIIGHEYYSTDHGLEASALLWEDGEVVYLNDLIGQADPLKAYVRLRTALQINDKGQIAVSARDSRAPTTFISYLLTPVRP